MCGKHCKRDSCIDVIESASCSMGYPELRSLQRRAVVSFVSGKDVFVCIPTGGGKLCYSILPRVFNLCERSLVWSYSSVLYIFAFNLDTFCKFLEQAITTSRAKRSVAVLELGLPTQPRNSKCLCLLGHTKSYALLLRTYHTVIVRHGSSDVAQLL